MRKRQRKKNFRKLRGFALAGEIRLRTLAGVYTEKNTLLNLGGLSNAQGALNLAFKEIQDTIAAMGINRFPRLGEIDAIHD